MILRDDKNEIDHKTLYRILLYCIYFFIIWIFKTFHPARCKWVSKFVVSYTRQAHMFTQESSAHSITDEKNSSYNTSRRRETKT